MWNWTLLFRTALAFGAGFSPALCASVETPSLAPQMASVFPHGARPGATLEIAIRGSNLDHARRFEFARPGIDAEIVSSEFRLLRARLRIRADAETGDHDQQRKTRAHPAL